MDRGVEASPIVDLVDEDADVASRRLDWLVGLAIDLFGLALCTERCLSFARSNARANYFSRGRVMSNARSALRNILMKLRIMKIDRAADVRSNAALEN
jgi:hypothetical protein